MVYGREFFGLQLHFAARAAALSGMPLARALLDCTNLYIRFGLGRDFDAADPTWQAYLSGLEGSPDLLDWTCGFYEARAAHDRPPLTVATVGCFSYARLGPGSLRLHFRNAEETDGSPLGAGRRDRRTEELRALFARIDQDEPAASRVAGTSWLYNLEAYRRLFPPSYLATAMAVDARLRHMPLWGQFLDRHGAVRQRMAVPFLHRLSSLQNPQGLAACFPFQALALEAPVSVFRDFYGR
jgi:hypothetical protein